jgi:hypothetical protein
MHMPNLHDKGIEAHVFIYSSPGIPLDQATRLINGVKLGRRVDPGHKFSLIHLHTALGEVDFMADVLAEWTDPRGHETRLIGEWVSAVRQLEIGGRLIVARTSTAVCMNMGG